MNNGRQRSKDDETFIKRLLNTFKLEADDHIKAISSGLLELEKIPEKEVEQKILNTIFRETHSLKGAARAVDLINVESICQCLETLFKDFKLRGIPHTPAAYDILQRSLDTMALIIDQGDDSGLQVLLTELESLKGFTPDLTPESPKKPVAKISSYPSSGRFNREGVVGNPAAPAPALGGTIRVDSQQLDNLLLQAEEMIFMKQSVNRVITKLNEMNDNIQCIMKKEKDGESEHLYLKEIQSQAHQLSRSLKNDHRLFAVMIDQHLEQLRDTMMLPFSTITESFPRMVRDMTRKSGKEVLFVVKGNDIRIDKRILEQIKMPLIHLIRNALDHGIETVAERKMRKKSPKGQLKLEIVQQESHNVKITISDDGLGLNEEKIKKRAQQLGLFNEKQLQQLKAEQVHRLIFRSEFSTSPIITDLSGRGLGLDIVSETVERLGGYMTVDSRGGKGVSFHIMLRMSLATFRGIQVQVSGRDFIVPTLNVSQVLNINRSSIKTVENRRSFKLGDTILSFASMADVLQLPLYEAGSAAAGSTVTAVIIEAGGRKMAFAVDQVLEEEEILVKELGRQLVRVRNISGATILGSGQVVPILNPLDLVKSAINSAGYSRPLIQRLEKEKAEKEKTVAQKVTAQTDGNSILVVEDSITSRMLLKNILESSGYRVNIAVDGIDGWLSLKQGEFDLVVSDIEMPGLDGFQLTQRIRADQALKQTPIVLVTSLESREDREKGIEAGADAYIVKSSFDQSNLLAVLKKLI